jgi:glutamate decarboxylase
VCRNGFHRDLADSFVNDLKELLPWLRRQPGPQYGPEDAPSFHH